MTLGIDTTCHYHPRAGATLFLSAIYRNISLLFTLLSFHVRTLFRTVALYLFEVGEHFCMKNLRNTEINDPENKQKHPAFRNKHILENKCWNIFKIIKIYLKHIFIFYILLHIIYYVLYIIYYYIYLYIYIYILENMLLNIFKFYILKYIIKFLQSRDNNKKKIRLS